MTTKKKGKKSKIRFQKEKILVTLFIFLTLPLSVLAAIQATNFFGKAQTSFTYKVTRNHQWTCEEQPDWGNEVHILVKDEAGRPLSGIQVEYWHDYRWGSKMPNDSPPLPSGVLTTDDQGKILWYNSWPGCLGNQCPNNGDVRVNFFFKVRNAPSDTAVEITTGYWGDECKKGTICPERKCEGCGGCVCVNVWGHWSYSIEFTKKSGSLTEEEIPTDHEGMLSRLPAEARNSCSRLHFYTPYVSYNPKRGGTYLSPTPNIPKSPTPALPTIPLSQYPTTAPGQPSPTTPYTPPRYPTSTLPPYKTPPPVATHPYIYPTSRPWNPPPTATRWPTRTPSPSPTPNAIVSSVNKVVDTVVNLPKATVETAVIVWEKNKAFWGHFFNTILP